MRDSKARPSRLPRGGGLKEVIAISVQGARGATSIEYGLIAALVAVVIITGLTALGSALNNKFGSVASEVENANPGGGASDEDSATEFVEGEESPEPVATVPPLTTEPSETPTDEPTTAPLDINFNADAYRIERGECTTLRWEVTGAEVVTVLGEEVEHTEAQEVCPSETRDYQLSAANASEEASSFFEIEVTEPKRERGCYTDANGALICP